jgi:hypothetical protein
MIKIRKINGKFLVVGVCYDKIMMENIESMFNDIIRCVLYVKSENMYVRMLSKFLLKNDISNYNEFIINEVQDNNLPLFHYHIYAFDTKVDRVDRFIFERELE